ncbi:hypothetical protein DS967_24100 [Escherichia coli]|uniref:hypothetical protein n=1 Tax=Enterobacteriaceae TaxID=543 RepID=UPI000DE82B52|nr:MULTISPECIES: hypothetical protein [Enterobacteriaceae]EEZ5292878.1 hypothetical protein [Escherichia coli]EFA6635763.1 hypothetical protein [Escherichia coli]EFB2477067.1 hypothetical protein [Escherichia coli]EFH6883059.1 hypothetical protein [Escherichia coli]EFH7304851.1 hypothetical protein [Escherichia coli]
MDELFRLSTAILASLGGGAMIIGAFVKWFSDLWAKKIIQDAKKKLDEDIESYKIKLKKSEFLFQKEFEAASELVALIRSFLPTYSHPQMDWYDACDEMAHNFSNIGIALNKYLSKHGAVLNEDAIYCISFCISTTYEHKFSITSPEVPKEANEAADIIYQKLKEAEKIVLQQVHSQSST